MWEICIFEMHGASTSKAKYTEMDIQIEGWHDERSWSNRVRGEAGFIITDSNEQLMGGMREGRCLMRILKWGDHTRRLAQMLYVRYTPTHPYIYIDLHKCYKCTLRLHIRIDLS